MTEPLTDGQLASLRALDFLDAAITDFDRTCAAVAATRALVREVDRLRAELARVEAERDEAREGAHQLDMRRPTTWAYEQACAALEKHRARADATEAKVWSAATVKCWTNEDGQRFVFAEDLAAALGLAVVPAGGEANQ